MIFQKFSLSLLDKKVKFSIQQAMKAQTGVRVYLYSFFNLSARQRWMVNATPRSLYPRERNAISIV